MQAEDIMFAECHRKVDEIMDIAEEGFDWFPAKPDDTPSEYALDLVRLHPLKLFDPCTPTPTLSFDHSYLSVDASQSVTICLCVLVLTRTGTGHQK